MDSTLIDKDNVISLDDMAYLRYLIDTLKHMYIHQDYVHVDQL